MTTLAIVGLGTIAQTHLAAWERLPAVELVAGVDIRDVEPWSFRGRCVPIHRRVAELAAYQPDCVVVATPTAVHFHTYGEIRNSLRTRILVEKPLASTLRDSLALLERPDDLVVLYHAAYAPEVRWAAERLSRWLDQFGPITSFHCLFADSWRHDPTTAAQRYGSPGEVVGGWEGLWAGRRWSGGVVGWPGGGWEGRARGRPRICGV